LNLLGAESFGEVLFGARQDECGGGVLRPRAARGEKAKENPDRDGIEPHGRCLQTGAFAKNQKVGDLRLLDTLPIADGRVFPEPIQKNLERVLNEKLVSLREAALGGQIHEEFFDIGLHRRAEFPRPHEPWRMISPGFCVEDRDRMLHGFGPL